jgi:hypothetical protein
MAALTITWTANSPVGSQLRGLARAIEQVAANVPDLVSSGASTVLTITAPDSPGEASVQITAGPYQSSKAFI